MDHWFLRHDSPDDRPLTSAAKRPTTLMKYANLGGAGKTKERTDIENLY